MKTMSPYDLGKKLTVEDCSRINISDFLKSYRERIKALILLAHLESVGLQIDLVASKTGYGGARYWFLCPGCKQRIGVLLKHPLSDKVGCRKCIGVEYRKIRYKGMLEGGFTEIIP